MQSVTRMPALKKGDMVQIIAGREKGKTGKVLRIDLKTSRIFVEKLNIVKRNTKPTQKNPQGGVLEKEAGLDVSNVQLLCAKCNRGVRFGIKQVGDKKSRACKKCGNEI
jgi:large subunit ribosomal protein L24